MIRALALFLVPTAMLLAQQDRITGPVDRLRTVRLRGNIHPRATPQFDAGPVDPSLKLDHVMVMLNRSGAQQAALEQLLAEQQDRSSPNYHAWLSPEQFGDRFGLSSNDIAQVVSWLQSEGLVVDEISRARNWIWFSGTAGQVQAALRTEIRRYRVDGELHYANAGEPEIPAAIGPSITGILGLNDFRPRSSHAARARASNENTPNSIRPQFSSPGGTHFLTPDDFATIYNLMPLYNAGHDGSGQRIVVAGQSAVGLADIQVFRSIYGLPKKDPQLVLVPGSPDPGHVFGDEGEADLDIEWSGAVARNANIIYVYSPDVRVSVSYAINQNLGSVLTLSYGSCEQENPPGEINSTRALAQQANAQGITWLASSGDSGAAGCDAPFTQNKASQGLGVSFPASLPEVTAVGGTQLDETGSQYWSASNSINFASALSYIPEKGWNESDADGLASSGGGLSVAFPKPSWQTAPGVPGANSRAVPDVSLSAAGHDGYLIVTQGVPGVASGTSAAAPSFAGILALVNHYQELNGLQTQSGQGNLNPNLYSLARNTAGVFHDIIAGDNIVPCAVATPDCSTGTLGYTAGPGYDPVTGLGSVDGFNLAVNLATQWITPAIALLSPGSVIAGTGDFTLAVNGTGFDPGSVVQWMGAPLPTSFVNGTQLLATVKGALIGLPGSVAVTVQSSRGTSAPVSLAINLAFGAGVSIQRVTTTAPPFSGCVVPPAVSSFVISDTVHLYFSAAVTANDHLTSDWLAPNGTVVAGVTWSVAAGFFCFANDALSLPEINFNPIGTWQARVFDQGSLLFSVPFSVGVPGIQTTPMAHAADGQGFKTTVLLTNTGSGPAPYTLRFNDDHGNVPTSRFELEAGSLTGVIPAGGSATIRTAGIGPQTVNGWAELTAPASVGGSVIYSQKNPNLPSIQEGTATIVASGSQHFFLPFDNTAKAITGVAITNPGASTANNISVTFHYSDGSPNETIAYPQVPSRNHQAFALASQFPHTANRSGVAEFTSGTALSTVVFRFNSTGAFTALDGTSAGGDATLITRPLAHAADGNGFKTTVLLTNTGSASASYTLRFNDDHGNIPTSRFELEAGSLTGTIPAGSSVTIRTAGLGDATVNGWAELTAPASVGGSVIYSQKTGLPSVQEGTATIVASGSTHFFLPFDNTAGAVTSMAITDPGASAANDIVVTLHYGDGSSEVVPYPSLAGRNHQAFAIASQFPNTANRTGVAEFTSGTALSTVVFRFNSTGAFTSFGTVAP